MEKRFVSGLIVSLALLGSVWFAGWNAGLWGEDKKPDIYNPSLDVRAALVKAKELATAENKHILLFFGANWCPWCHRLHALMNSDAGVKKFLDAHYVLIMVDIGEKKGEALNSDLVEQCRVKGMGYPAVAILDARGSLVCAQSTGVLEKGKAHDPERVLAFLKASAPQSK